MSIQFAPQYAKSIKPTGSSLTPTTDTPPILSKSNMPNVPFPALSAVQRSSSPTTATSTGQPLSYSRVIHTPVSPAFPHDGSYFPLAEGVSGNADGHPFRYSAETMLSLWDEEKVKAVPIELFDLADGGAGLVSRVPRKPAGLGEFSEQQKKLLASSIHPPVISRRQIVNTNGASNPPEAPVVNGGPRRPAGSALVGKEGGFGGGRMGGFGRGEGGALGGGRPGTIGGGVLSPNGDGKMPGTLGGGFGGVGRRLGRGRMESGDAGDGTRIGSTPWRPARTASGNFEGVLGFGGSMASSIPQAAPPTVSDTSAEPTDPPSLQEQGQNGGWREKHADGREKAEVRKDKEPEHPAFGSGGGPGWGSGPKKWRQAAGFTGPPDGDKQLGSQLGLPSQMQDIPGSAVATASATPIPERDATMVESQSPPQQSDELTAPSSQPVEQKEDLGAVEWLYRDPGGLEQGPFTGTQMHDWYSHSYFADDLPIRRASQTSYTTLGELKTATGNAVQPFLSVPRPRILPPNLPFPSSALAANHTPLVDTFRNLNVQNTHVPSFVSPNPQPHILNSYAPERNPVFGADSFNSQPPFPHAPVATAPFGPTPGQPWGAPHQPFGARFNAPFSPAGVPTPIGSAPLYNPQQLPTVYSPVIGGPLPRNDMFSPSVGVGAPPVSPWGVPQPPQQSSPFQQIQPAPVWQPPPSLANNTAEALAEEPPSYPPVDEVTSEQIQQAEDEATPTEEEFEAPSETIEAAEAAEAADRDHTSSDSEPAVATPVQAATPPSEPAIPTPRSSVTPVSSVWGQKASPVVKPPTKRLPSNTAAPTAISIPSTTATSKLPPAPASLPAKPVTVRTGSISEAAQPVSTPEKGTLPSRPAPWAAVSESKSSRTPSAGLSLREIQEAESKQAEVRKQALAAARAASPAIAPSTDDVPTSMTWGLPSQGSKTAAPVPAPSASPAAPAWGSGDAGPKRTLKQIQEEEEKRKVKLAAQQRASQTTPLPGSVASAAVAAKRVYADLAANVSTAQPTAGWTTIGSSGKPSGTLPAKPTVSVASVAKPAASVIASPSVTQPAVATKNSKSNGSDDFSAPSVEFLRWVKTALTGLDAPIEEFVQMLLSFPIDPPASQRPEVLEIISDSVYASSSTLDGRRFAQEFYTKRKADASRPKDATAATKKVGSLADVVKAVPKKAEDAGFKIVKAKGKKKN